MIVPLIALYELKEALTKIEETEKELDVGIPLLVEPSKKEETMKKLIIIVIALVTLAPSMASARKSKNYIDAVLIDYTHDRGATAFIRVGDRVYKTRTNQSMGEWAPGDSLKVRLKGDTMWVLRTNGKELELHLLKQIKGPFPDPSF